MALRASSRKARRELGSDHRETASRAICRHLLASNLYHRAGTVAAYLAFGDEVDLAILIGAALAERPGKRLALPRMVPGEVGRLSMHLADLTALELHPYGPQQPTSTAPPIRATELDLVLVPGLAFDRSGRRLGYGRGYYDRLLAQVPRSVPRIGVCFDALVVESVPVADHDARLTHLVTESGLLPVTDSLDRS